MQRLMHTFSGMTAPQHILDAVRQGVISSFCLFRHMNVESPAQLRELNLSLVRAAHEGGLPAPIIGIDQEGGQLVAIAGGATELPGNMALGATRSPDLAYKAGQVLGRELLAMGVNLNFAPSLDVNINPVNPVIGIRSFGDDPALVAELGTAMILGTQAEGVIATAKHFPGHGDTATDSHHSVPVVHHDLERVREVELLPFVAAVRAGVKAVMSGHVLYSQLDETTPATLSNSILTGLLRGELGFQGLVLTDAMDMHAVARLGALECVEQALLAGVDLALLAHLPGQMEMIAPLMKYEDAASTARIMAARREIPAELPPLSVVGSAEHLQIAQDIADHAVTLVKNSAAQIPLHPAADDRIVVIMPIPVNLTPADTSGEVTIELAAALRKRHASVQALDLPFTPTDSDIRAALDQCADAAHIIVGTIGAEANAGQAALVNALIHAGHAPIVISMRTPYDLLAFPQVQTYLCAYGIRAVQMEAVARVLLGEIPARGVLPCGIPGIAASGAGIVPA